MKKLIYRISTFVLILSFFTSGLLIGVSAQSFRGTVFGGLEVNGQSTDTLNFDLGVVQPGEQINGSFFIRNEFDSEDPVRFSIRPLNFLPDPTGSTPSFLENEDVPTTENLAEWINLDTSQLTINEYGERATINFTIDIPEEAEPGSKNAGILVRRLAEGETFEEAAQGTGAQFVVNAQTGPLILLMVDGDLNSDLNVTNVYTTNIHGNNTDFLIPGLFFQQPVNLVIEFANGGNINITPRGQIFVHRAGADFVTDAIEQFELNPVEDGSRRRVLANSERTFTYPWEDGFISKVRITDPETRETRIQSEYNFDKLSKLRLGQYQFTAQYDFEDGEGNRVETQTLTASFWVIPIPIIILVFTLTILFGYFVWKKKSQAKK